jgi:NTP pyrophosphatase (non-canonical NTP hydrolase)
LIKDQSGNTLQTFTTSGTYTVEVLQEIIDTINSNTATIIDPIV